MIKSPVIYYTEEEPLYYIYPHHLNESETSWVGYSFSMQGNHIYIDNSTYVIIGENKIATLIAPYCEEARGT